MKQLTIACTPNGLTWCGPAADTPPGCINVHNFEVADLGAVLETMRDVFARTHVRGNFYDHRFTKPEEMAARITPPVALQVAA